MEASRTPTLGSESLNPSSDAYPLCQGLFEGKRVEVFADIPTPRNVAAVTSTPLLVTGLASQGAPEALIQVTSAWMDASSAAFISTAKNSSR